MENYKKKLRLLLFEECNRNCPGCCNRDWNLTDLSVCRNYAEYDLIMLTGGEPMLHPDIIRQAVSDIRRETDAPIILYTALVEGLDDIMPLINGVTVTLHDKRDIEPFLKFASKTECLENKMLRLNVFKEAGNVAAPDNWRVKDSIEWIKDCPLADNETFLRYKANT